MSRTRPFTVHLTRFLLILMLLAGARPALADPVRWHLQDWTFENGMVASGSFVFNVDIPRGNPLRWANISIHSDIGDTTFNFEGTGAISDQLAFVTDDHTTEDLTDTFALIAELETGMTNAGGTINLVVDGGTNFNSSQTVCASATCGSSDSPIFLVSGAITSQPPPEGNKLVLGLGPDGAAYLEVLDALQAFTHDDWLQTWHGGGGESRPAACDVDGDGKDELVIGMGPGSEGWIQVRDDESTEFAHLAWVQVDWPEYNAANGETWPACGDLDGDGRDEIVLGLGAGGNGYATLLDDAVAGYALLSGTPNGEGWIRVGWDDYNNGQGGAGEVRPAVGNLDEDPADELILGLGRGGAGWVVLFDDWNEFFAPIFPANAPAKSGAWMQVTWNSYNVANGEIWPAICDLYGNGREHIVMALGTGGDGFVQVFDSATGFAPSAGTPQEGGWLQLDWADYRAVEGSVHPACGNLDNDAADELVLGLGVYPADGGWLEVFDDLNSGLQGNNWIRLKWPTYNSVSGLTRPAIVE